MNKMGHKQRAHLWKSDAHPKTFLWSWDRMCPSNNLGLETLVLPHLGFEKPGYASWSTLGILWHVNTLIGLSDHVCRCAINSSDVVSRTRNLMVNNEVINTLKRRESLTPMNQILSCTSALFTAKQNAAKYRPDPNMPSPLPVEVTPVSTERS